MAAQAKNKAVRPFACLFASVFVFIGGSPAPAMASAGTSAEVGVYVETTLPPPPPPTTAVPVTTAPTTPTTSPQTSTPESTIPTTVPETITTDDSLLEEFKPTPNGAPEISEGFVSQVKSVAKVTSTFIKNVAAGEPVAEVAERMLPEPVAEVVVPAIRTASTFVFPIGLAGAVIGFLGLQQRIDSTDPKLRAAPIAHGDEMVTFS